MSQLQFVHQNGCLHNQVQLLNYAVLCKNIARKLNIQDGCMSVMRQLLLDAWNASGEAVQIPVCKLLLLHANFCRLRAAIP